MGKKYSDEINKKKGRKGRVGPNTGKNKDNDKGMKRTSEKLKGRKIGRRYIMTDEIKKKISNSLSGKLLPEKVKKKLRKTFVIIYKDGKTETVNDLKRWCFEHGVNYHSFIQYKSGIKINKFYKNLYALKEKI